MNKSDDLNWSRAVSVERNKFINRKSTWLVLLSLLLGCGLIGCGYGTYAVAGFMNDLKGNTVDHSFEFNAHTDSPGIEVLDYEYSTRKPDKDQLLGLNNNSVPQGSSITGGFPRGDFVYMKWRIRATGEVFEDRVDLRQRLPSDIRNQRIYCVIDGGRLSLLLIDLKKYRERVTSDELKKSEADANTPVKHVLTKYILYRVKQIYPDPITQLR